MSPLGPVLGAYSPECVEYGFCELRVYGVLRSPHGPTSGEMGLRWSCQGYCTPAPCSRRKSMGRSVAPRHYFI